MPESFSDDTVKCYKRTIFACLSVLGAPRVDNSV